MIRECRESDAPAAARLIRLLKPGWLVTPDWLAHFIGTLPERAQARFWVAEENGNLVGWAEAFFNWAQERRGAASVWAGVVPHRRGRGLGRTLFETAETYLLERNAAVLRSHAEARSDGLTFLEGRGYQQIREEVFSDLDPRDVDLSQLQRLESELVASGFRLATLAEVLDRRRDLYELYRAAEADMPSDNPHTGLGYDDFLSETLGNPILGHEGSFVVLAGHEPVSLAWILVDAEAREAVHELTGTLREYRRRGLARLGKLATIRWAAENGIERLMTGNDGENAGMLALNRELGYRPSVTWAKLAKETGAD